MKKKILIVVAVVLAVIVVGGVILVTNLGRIVEARKGALLAQAEERIGREVTVGNITVAVFPSIGVSLSNVVLAEDPAFGADPFVRVRDLRVNVKLLPLLRKQIEVKRFVLNGAVINIARNEEGRFNFDSLVEAAGGDSGGGGASGSPGAAAAFVLAVADIEDGTVHYTDRASGLDQTVRDIDFTARDVSLDQKVSFELAAAVFGEAQDVRVKGSAGPVGADTSPEALRDVPLDVTASLGPVTPGAVTNLLPGAVREQAAALDVGTVTADLAVRGTLGAIRVEDLVARAAVLGADDPNVTAEMELAGIDPLAETPDLSAVTVEGTVEAGPLPLARLGGLAGELPPDLSLDGEGSATLRLSGTAANLSIEATLDGAAATVAMGETFRKPAGTAMGVSLKAVRAGTSVDISSLEARLHNLTLTGKGTVATGADVPRVDFSLSSGKTDLSGWGAMLPAATQFSPRGTFAIEVTAKGPVGGGAVPAVEGTLTVENAGATLAQLPEPVHDARATVRFTDKSARIDNASLAVGESVIRASLNATSLTPLDASYRVTSDRIHRDDFQVPPGNPMPRPEVLDDVVAEGRIQADPAAPGLVDHQGTVTSAKGTVANLDYTDLSATIRSEGEAIVIDEFRANSLDGVVKGSGRVNPTAVPPTFDIRTEVDDVNLTSYFQYKFPSMTNVIEGRIDLNLNVAGAGTTWDEIASSLEGAGGAVVVRGALLNVNLANELVSSLQGLPMVPAGLGERLRSKHPKLFSGTTTAFQNLDGEFRIDGGRISTDDLFMEAADFMVKGDGWLAFDRTLQIRTQFIFSKALSGDIVGELPVAKYLENAEGRIVLPLVLSGDVTKPRIVPDADAISAALQRGVVDQGRNRLEDEIKDRLGDGVKDLFGGLKKKDAKADTTGTKR